MLKRERTLEAGAVANTLPLADTPIPTSRKSSVNAFTVCNGGPTVSLDLKAFCAAAGAATSMTVANRRLTDSRTLLIFIFMGAHSVMDARAIGR